MNLSNLLDSHNINNIYLNGQLHLIDDHTRHINNIAIPCVNYINISEWPVRLIYDWLGY